MVQNWIYSLIGNPCQTKKGHFVMAKSTTLRNFATIHQARLDNKPIELKYFCVNKFIRIYGYPCNINPKKGTFSMKTRQRKVDLKFKYVLEGKT